MHITQNVEELSADAAVSEEGIDGVVPTQNKVSVLQGLSRFVMGTHTVTQ
jgi:hypothetical protein